jgi:hypothetical protein
MFRQFLRDLSKPIAEAPWFFIVFCGLLLVFLCVTLIVLEIEWWFKTIDLFPGSTRLLPWAVAFCVVVIAVTGIALIYGARCAAYPGTLLYRLTHFGPRLRR